MGENGAKPKKNGNRKKDVLLLEKRIETLEKQIADYQVTLDINRDLITKEMNKQVHTSLNLMLQIVSFIMAILAIMVTFFLFTIGGIDTQYYRAILIGLWCWLSSIITVSLLVTFYLKFKERKVIEFIRSTQDFISK